jgi:capsule polysaccharide modification protein KpsS
VRHALLLQGPAGPFFRRFGDELAADGVRVTKVNLHAGDALFYSGPGTLSYRGALADWREWVTNLMRTQHIDGVFVFGDCRSYHRLAIEAARELGVAVWVFEEGYLRPDWITLERDGVNGNSQLPRTPEVYLDAYRAAGSPPEKPIEHVGQTFALGAWYSTLNAVAFTFANQRFPLYEHHRNLSAGYHAYHWVLGASRKAYFARTEEGVLEDIVDRWSGRYFFVPLQVHCDFQIQHSPYDDVTDFIHEVVASFASDAPKDCALVLKHHPMDRPFRDYTRLFRDLAREHGLEGRLYYVHDLHLPTLLQNARGTVTINSTVGLSSIHHGTPVMTMGTAVYDIDGLTRQGTLADMWSDPGTVNRELVLAFRWWLLESSQGNGHAFRRVYPCQVGTGVRWPSDLDSSNPDLSDSGRTPSA